MTAPIALAVAALFALACAASIAAHLLTLAVGR